ncbi:hypothetical protein BJV82DRAFT_617838 [Fennellomyces sp. T-0311]|nr:hypothetical protein BJV82DRAFT_617838 [Fennellomyces sp. T-0311]
MNDSFAYNDTFNNRDDPMEDLFPPLNQEGAVNFDAIGINEEADTLSDQQQPNEASRDLLWHDVDNLSIPDFQQVSQNEPSSSTSETNPARLMVRSESKDEASAEQSAVFNISWGGSNDRPPAELHLEHEHESEMVSRRPLPKPRGVKRLPEPEPAEDGSLDEDTLRRRRNTNAARRSRLKKFLKIEYLENRVNQLQTENAKLVLNNALLESEKRGWAAKEAEYKKRIKLLESSSGHSSSSGTPPAEERQP